MVTNNLQQLLLIQTLGDIFGAESKVYEQTQARHLLKFVDLLSQGYLSARNFNERFRKYLEGKKGELLLHIFLSCFVLILFFFLPFFSHYLPRRVGSLSSRFASKGA